MLFVSIFLLGNIAFAQPSWKDKMTLDYSVTKDGDCKAVIKFKAKLVPGFHIFSISHDPEKADFTGTPTTIEVEPSKNFKLIGKLAESKKPMEHKDELGTSLYFENTVEFLQKLEILTDKSFILDLRFTGQICDESGCVQVNKDFKVEFKNYCRSRSFNR